MKKLLFVCFLALGVATLSVAQPAKYSDPDQKAKGLQKQLKLTDPQTSKIAAIYKESASKFEEIKKKDHGDTNKMLTDVGPLRKATVAKIKALLNPHQAA